MNLHIISFLFLSFLISLSITNLFIISFLKYIKNEMKYVTHLTLFLASLFKDVDFLKLVLQKVGCIHQFISKFYLNTPNKTFSSKNREGFFIRVREIGENIIWVIREIWFSRHLTPIFKAISLFSLIYTDISFNRLISISGE